MKVADFGKKKGSGPEGVAPPRGAGGNWNREEAGGVVAEERAGGGRFS